MTGDSIGRRGDREDCRKKGSPFSGDSRGIGNPGPSAGGQGRGRRHENRGERKAGDHGKKREKPGQRSGMGSVAERPFGFSDDRHDGGHDRAPDPDEGGRPSGDRALSRGQPDDDGALPGAVSLLRGRALPGRLYSGAAFPAHRVPDLLRGFCLRPDLAALCLPGPGGDSGGVRGSRRRSDGGGDPFSLPV